MDSLISGCLSCDVVAKKVIEPGGTIYEDEFWQVGSIMAPVVWRGFLIIKLKRHCEHLAELTPQEAATLGIAIQTTCRAVMEVLQPAKVFVCSFGDGVKHVHFWVLPRPPEMRSGMHPVMFYLDVRTFLTRLLGIKHWIVRDSEVEKIADQLRTHIQEYLVKPVDLDLDL
jgi:diadenosine tetraphosphate (Ap4A) HIT family hydrolase